MARESEPFDVNDAIRRYQAGARVGDLARLYRVRTTTVSDTLKRAGVTLRRTTPPLPVEDICRRYLDGESEKSLAEAFGVERSVIRRRLINGGIMPRNRSEAMYARMAKMTDDERRALTSASHDAVRGRRRPLDALVRAAQTREERMTHISAEELLLQQWIFARTGMFGTPQKAVGKYNVDLVVGPVAVEVFGGSWHMTRDPIEAMQERFRYILDQGFAVLVIWVDRRRWPMREAVADHVVTLLELARRDPSARGQYWMVRGNGEALVACGDDLDKLTFIPSFGGGAS